MSEIAPLTKKKIQKISIDLESKFMEKFTFDPDNLKKCFLWTGAKSSSGYPCINVNGNTKLAHRVSYVLFNGNIPKNKLVMHSCNTPLCVNPDHLYLGTHSDCQKKMYLTNPLAKVVRFKSRISHDCLKVAANLANNTNLTLKEIGAKIGISGSQLRHLLKKNNLTSDLRKKQHGK